MAGLEHITWLLTLVSFFGVLSVLATAMAGWWAHWRGWREAGLRDTLCRLLRTDEEARAGLGRSAWGEAVLAHPRISPEGRTPGHLAPAVFAEVAWHVLARQEQPQALRGQGAPAAVWQVMDLDAAPPAQLLRELPADTVERQRAALADWFNQAMAQASLRYQARTRRFLFGLGFVLSMVANVNALRVAEGLQADPATAAALQGQLVSEPLAQAAARQAQAMLGADDAQPDQASPPAPSATSAQSAADALDAARVLASVPQHHLWGWRQGLPEGWRAWALQVLGCLLTALAVAQGAEFWFDLLKRMTSVRPAKAG